MTETKQEKSMIETKREKGILTVKVRGRVDGANASDFQKEVRDSFSDKDKVVLLDMEKLSYISSAGLRVILMIAKALEERKATFMIYSLTEPIREVFGISGFDKIIKVRESRDQALASIFN